MAFLTGKGSVVYANKYDLSSYIQSAEVAINCQSHDTTTFGKNWRKKIGGLLDGSASLSGLHDAAANASDAVLHAMMGDNTGFGVIIGIGGGAATDRCRILKTKPGGFSIGTPVDGLITVSAEFQPDGGVMAGDILKALAAETAATNGTSVDNGFATSNGGVGIIIVTAETGTNPTLDGKFQHSSDNSSWSDLTGATITQIADLGWQMVTVAAGATVNRYVRWISTAYGGTSTPGYTYATAFARR